MYSRVPSNLRRSYDLSPNKAHEPRHVRAPETCHHQDESHQWGMPNEDARRAMTTTRGNLEAKLNGIDFRVLPERYRESILICKSLGIRYIWIDSLCIIQACRLNPFFCIDKLIERTGFAWRLENRIGDYDLSLWKRHSHDFFEYASGWPNLKASTSEGTCASTGLGKRWTLVMGHADEWSTGVTSIVPPGEIFTAKDSACLRKQNLDLGVQY
jgi:Heterokaryon incompatibility protein (HET)